MSSRLQVGDIKQYAPRIIVARPRAVPIPLPLIAFGPTRLNLYQKSENTEGMWCC
jgi:hypothetical protein